MEPKEALGIFKDINKSDTETWFLNNWWAAKSAGQWHTYSTNRSVLIRVKGKYATQSKFAPIVDHFKFDTKETDKSESLSGMSYTGSGECLACLESPDGRQYTCPNCNGITGCDYCDDGKIPYMKRSECEWCYGSNTPARSGIYVYDLWFHFNNLYLLSQLTECRIFNRCGTEDRSSENGYIFEFKGGKGIIMEAIPV